MLENFGKFKSSSLDFIKMGLTFGYLVIPLNASIVLDEYVDKYFYN